MVINSWRIEKLFVCMRCDRCGMVASLRLIVPEFLWKVYPGHEVWTGDGNSVGKVGA